MKRASNFTNTTTLQSLLYEIVNAQKSISDLMALTASNPEVYSEFVSVASVNMKKKEYELKRQAVEEVHHYKVTQAVKQKNGKPYVYFRTVYDNKGHSMTSRSEEELYEKLFTHYFGDMDVFKLNSKDEMIMAELYEKWKSYRLNELQKRQKTIKRTEDDYNKYLRNLPLMQEKVKDVTAKDLRNLFKRMCPQMTKKAFGNTKSILNGMFAYAVEELEIIPYDICTPIRVNRYKGYEFKPTKSHNTEVYTKAEREKILNYLESLPKQTGYTWGIRLMFCLDLRIGELKALKWNDYLPEKFEKPMIRIDNQVVYDVDINGKHTVRELEHTKAKDERGERLNYITPRAKKILDEIQAAGIISDYILCTQVGTPIYTDKFNNVLKEVCAAVGVEYHSSHRLRNYSITEQCRENPDIPQIAYNSGQLDNQTTLNYLRRAVSQMQDYDEWCRVHD